ncbi:hypothetical protein B0I32_15613 [Nonomuraea fuscirosea]|uniref:Uncharacterized protein n=1 Tax=Nonomuraea fuscirosea TaxID=1291556 RepID=A0A2T0LKE3_9ACTN|nr:hypothetical protein B0I32_15613 [Nonomuraea fuscirosea]
MTVSTLVAAVMVLAIAVIIVRTVLSLLSGSPALRRGSGNPGNPFVHGSSTPGAGSYSSDSGGNCSGGDGGGGGCA